VKIAKGTVMTRDKKTEKIGIFDSQNTILFIFSALPGVKVQVFRVGQADTDVD